MAKLSLMVLLRLEADDCQVIAADGEQKAARAEGTTEGPGPHTGHGAPHTGPRAPHGAHTGPGLRAKIARLLPPRPCAPVREH